MEEESAHLDKTEYPYQEQQYFDLSNAKKLPPKQLAILRALFEEREKTAKKLDLPNFMVFRNEVLLDVVSNPPDDASSWEKLRGIHPLVRKEAEKWLRLITAAQNGPGEVYQHQAKKLNSQQFEWKEELTELRKKIGAQFGIRGSLLMNNDQIIEIVTSKSLQSLRNWQKELINGEKIVKDNFYK
jgi:ribonuclease D